MTNLYRWLMALFILFLSIPSVYAELRDPTRPDNVQEFSAMNRVQSWGLEAIIISHQRRLAIINGRTVRVGDKVAGFDVTDIQPNTVHLSGPDGNITLFLFNRFIKREI